MVTKSKSVRALEYFPSQAPPGALFKSRLNDLRGISHLGHTHRSNEILELVQIGLTAYFETFCKDQFGSMICIDPTLIKNLSAAGKDTNLDISLIIEDFDQFNHQIGFYLSEKYDFGSPKKVNSLFKALIGITPFSTKSIALYDSILHDRNLLAHHGGTYTSSYVKNTKTRDPTKAKKAFQDGIVVDYDQLNRNINLVEGIAYSIVANCYQSLTKHLKLHRARIGSEKQKAIQFLLYWE